ncbi:GNAT family N-acetyltransferase [Aurantimonas sp. 22II-16-19i]|uniref:GNAT family N-acetyltransferase n=1 Tax=Aurantimonas sp. 22II-16-19i TaxID=1317114 RepID=UPI00159492E0|nr:GNAT family N-acetyltransferase [Aurantimonas sp. 22II-16-19i]
MTYIPYHSRPVPGTTSFETGPIDTRLVVDVPPVHSGAGRSPLPGVIPPLKAQITSPAEFIKLEAEWRELVERSLHPNVFMEPVAVLAAAAVCRGALRVVLVWDDASCTRRLVGAWALLEPSTLYFSGSRVLVAPIHPHAPLSTPVIDRAMAGHVLASMFEAIEAEPDLPKLVELAHLDASRGFLAALEAASLQQGGRYRLFDMRQRPELGIQSMPPDSGAAVSKNRKRSMDRRRRRLARLGDLAVDEIVDAGDLAAALEEFLALEGAGWKGRRTARGRALLLDADAAFYAREVVQGLAARRLARLFVLRLDGRAVAVRIVLQSGAGVFTWKSSYDEALREYSPGLLLLEDVTGALLDDRALTFADSCNHHDEGYMSEFWHGRKPVTSALINVGSANLLHYSLVKGQLLASWQMKALARRALRQMRQLASRLRSGVGPDARQYSPFPEVSSRRRDHR